MLRRVLNGFLVLAAVCAQAADVWREYPRPQMVREGWTSLSGHWDYAIRPVEEGIPERFDGKILVPFPQGSRLSGVVGNLGHTNALWYARTVELHPRAGEKILLHVDGCDCRTMVFLNGVEAMDVPHEATQLAFTVDLTKFAKDGANRIDVQVWDPMTNRRKDGQMLPYFSSGKQILNPSHCHYTASSGFWAPVWLETVPADYISGYRVVTDIDAGTVKVEVEKRGGGGQRIEISAFDGDRKIGDFRPLSTSTYSLHLQSFECWSPENPKLYTFTVKYGRDEIRGYFAMRKFEVRKDANGIHRFFLNNRPYFALGTLDQGWWPDGLLTPPSDEAMVGDIRRLKDLGFNMMRKHVKVEPMRYYYHCDRLGILVFQDMPTGEGSPNARIGGYRAEWKGIIDQLYNVPSIVMWIPYNERWGQPASEAQTAWTLEWTKRYDPSRVCDGPSGWGDFSGGYWKSSDGKGTLTRWSHLAEGVAEPGEVIDFHHYPDPKMLPVNTKRATFIGEFGGLAVNADGTDRKKAWGYNVKGATDVASVEAKYLEMMATLEGFAATNGLAGSVYTQTADTEQEVNGLYTEDRVLKFDAEKLRAAHARILAAAARAAVEKPAAPPFVERGDPSRRGVRAVLDEPTTVAAKWKPAAPRVRKSPLMTPWGEKVTPENAWREYPRPQMVRKNWMCLNGLWKYAIRPVESGFQKDFDGEILVPFAVGSALSGVTRHPGWTNCVWYSRTVELDPKPGERTLFHVDGADFRTQVFVNGTEATDVPHESAQTALTVDITRFVRKGTNRIDLEVWDPMGDARYPGFSSGKQTLRPGGCHYTASSGIWAPVWIETVPADYISGYRVVTDVDAGTVKVEVEKRGGGGQRIEISAFDGDRKIGDFRPLSTSTYSLHLDSFECWSPENPKLYAFTAKYGKDEIRGYFAMRKFEVRKDATETLKFFLNNRPYFALGTLDQGWWPDGLLTPPSDEAMVADIRFLKGLGYNMMRKHIKVEPMRYYYHCDRLGILVFQDMPSGSGDINGRYASYRAEWKGVIDQLYNVPSIVMWIPYNERWGQPGAAQTSWTLKWTKRYDPSRVVDGPSGWSDYEGGYVKPVKKGEKFRATDHFPEGVPESAEVLDFHNYPGPTMLPVNSHRATFIGEFGGLGVRVPGHVWDERRTDNWGYGGTGGTNAAPVEAKFMDLMGKVRALSRVGLAGSVYTQTTDVEQEINGLVTYDRRVEKFDRARIAALHAEIVAGANAVAAGDLVVRTLVPKRDPDPTAWAYSFAEPPDGWTGADFDDSGWKRSAGGFGSKGAALANREVRLATEWKTKEIWLRRTFEWTGDCEPQEAFLEIFHDDDVVVYLNGQELFSEAGYNHSYVACTLDRARFLRLVRKGRNVLAVKVVQSHGGQFIDLSLCTCERPD